MSAWRAAVMGLTILVLGPAASAGGTAEPGARVGEQMRRLFAARLKSDVGLDDAQIRAVLPRIEELERNRARGERIRLGLLRELRRGLAEGMADDALLGRLAALDRLGQDNERAARGTLAEIDRDLNVPQRVRLRFLMARFRHDMARRLQEVRQEGRGAGGPRRRAHPEAPPSVVPQ